MRQSFRRLFLVPLLAAGILLSGASPAFAASAASVLIADRDAEPVRELCGAELDEQRQKPAVQLYALFQIRA